MRICTLKPARKATVNNSYYLLPVHSDVLNPTRIIETGVRHIEGFEATMIANGRAHVRYAAKLRKQLSTAYFAEYELALESLKLLCRDEFSVERLDVCAYAAHVYASGALTTADSIGLVELLSREDRTSIYAGATRSRGTN